MSYVLVWEQPWEIKINIVDITSWFVQTTTHNEKLPGSLAFDEMKRMSCYLLLKVNKFTKKNHNLNNSHFDSMYTGNHKLLFHAFRTWSALKKKMGQTNPLAKKVYNLRHLFSSIVLLCVNASGLSKRIKSLFRLTTHLLILVYNCISCPRYVHIFLDSIFEGNYTIVRSFSVFEHPVYIKFFILIILHLY